MKKTVVLFLALNCQLTLFCLTDEQLQNQFLIVQCTSKIEQLETLAQKICKLRAETKELFNKKQKSFEVQRYHTVLASLYELCEQAGNLLFACRQQMEAITDPFGLDGVGVKLSNLDLGSKLPSPAGVPFCRDLVFQIYLAQAYTAFGAETALRWAKEVPFLAYMTRSDDFLLLFCQEAITKPEHVEYFIDQIINPLGYNHWGSKRLTYQIFRMLNVMFAGRVENAGIEEIIDIIQFLQIKDRSIFSQVEKRRIGIKSPLSCKNDQGRFVPIAFNVPYDWSGRTVFLAGCFGRYHCILNDLSSCPTLFVPALQLGHLAKEIKNWYFTQTNGNATIPDYATLTSLLSNLLKHACVGNSIGTTFEDATELIEMLLYDNPAALECFLNNPEEFLEETRWQEGVRLSFDAEKPYPISRIVQEAEKLRQQFSE